MITYNCLLDMKGFPFDEHNCTMELIFFKDNVHMIKFDKPSAYFHAHMQRSTKFEITYLEVGCGTAKSYQTPRSILFRFGGFDLLTVCYQC